jgi:hypothetical protein
LDKGGVIGVIVVESVGGAIGKLHAQAKGKVVLRAGLAEALELLHAVDLREFAGGAEEVTLGFGAGGVFETKDNGVADHEGKGRVANDE